MKKVRERVENDVPKYGVILEAVQQLMVRTLMVRSLPDEATLKRIAETIVDRQLQLVRPGVRDADRRCRGRRPGSRLGNDRAGQCPASGTWVGEPLTDRWGLEPRDPWEMSTCSFRCGIRIPGRAH